MADVGVRAAAALLLLAAAAAADTNIVVLLANNIRTDDLSCYNPKTPVRTPNIDRLAAGGVLLQHHTVPALTLTANRAAHLTGRLPVRYGLQEDGRAARQILHTMSRAGLPDSVVTYADMLSKFGYRTKAAGSWELGWGCETWEDACHSPLSHGFDSFYGLPLSAAADVDTADLPQSQVEPMDALNAYLEVMANRSEVRDIYRPIAETAWYQWLAEIVTSDYSFQQKLQLTQELREKLDYLLVRDDAVVRWPHSLKGMSLPILFESLEFIKQSKRENKPFLLHHTFLHVHRPSITAPHRVGNSRVNSYYDSVLELDWSVGRVLDQLEKLDLLDNTLVYFAADYNELMSFPPSESKITDSRIPGLFLFPNLVQPHVMQRPTSVLDVLPTVVDAVGKGEELLAMELDGRSLFFPLITMGETSLSRHFSYRGDQLDSATVTFPDDDDQSVYKIYITSDCQLCKDNTTVYNLTEDPYQTDPISQEDPVFDRVSEDVRDNLFVVESEPSQLGDFWRLMPLPSLYPWSQAAVYRPGVNTSGAADLYAFLEADVVFANEEPRSGAFDELDPELAQFYRLGGDGKVLV